MAWGRLALLQVAEEADNVLDKMADVFAYSKVLPTDEKDAERKALSPQKEAKTKSLAANADETNTSRPKHQPSYFLRVNKKQRLQQHKEEYSTYFTDPKSRGLTASKGSYHFPTASPLLSSAQLLPFLFNGLGVQRATHNIDYRRLIRQLETGKPLIKSPYLTQQRWPQQLMIIVDASAHLEPYWVDFAQIVQQLKTLLGQEAVTAVRFYEDSLDKKIPYCITWPTTDNDHYQAWHMPAEAVPILVLSDLGVIDPHYRMAVRWRRFFQPLQQQRMTIVTLSPVAQSPDDVLFCQQLKPSPLNDSHVLPRNPYCCGFRLEIEHELQQTMLNYALMFLSALPLVDSVLLRRLRVELQWGGSELEAMLWNHPKVSVMGLGIRLYETEAEPYRKQYQQVVAGTAKAKQFWRIVHEHHQYAFAGLKQLEKLNECVLEQTHDEELEQYLKQFCVSLAQSKAGSAQHKALFLQGKTLLASRPEAIWRSDFQELAYDIYALVNADDIRAGHWPDTFEDGFQPQKAQARIDKKSVQEQQEWLLVQQNNQAAFSFITAEQYHPLMNPIARFSEIKHVAPTLKEQQMQYTQAVKAGRSYQFSATRSVINIRSTTHHIELEAIKKPTWAQRIWQDKQGLRVSVLWLGKEYIFPWRVADNETKGQWHWQDPFGEDQYGVYVDLYINKNVTQRFRWIEPTTFMMGSPKNEVGRWDEHETQHQVTLTQGYWLADTTVTQAFWQAVMGGNPSYFTAKETGSLSTAQHPVEQVNGDDCQQFISTLKQKFPALNARLPSEAEWENACRAGTQTPFNFAGEVDLAKVNYSGEFDDSGYEKEALQRTAPVKSYPSNAWGLYEMHGNVWEWCQDFWVSDLGAEAAIDPVVLDEGTHRVLRGGSWGRNGRNARSAMRNNRSPGYRFNFLGLRLALGQPSYSQPSTASSLEQPRHQGGQARARAATVSTEAVDAELGKKTVWSKLRGLFTNKTKDDD